MSKNSINKNLADFLFFQIAVEVNILDAHSDKLTKDEIKKIDSTKTVWTKTNDSILTPDNWSKKVDIFYKQRMETYNKSYTDAEKINLELERLEKLTINKTEYKILKSRYKDYLLSKLQEPQQIVNNKGFENMHWFKIGLLFANGKMKELLESNNNNSTKVAELLGNKNYRPFISESIGYNEASDKNIFNSFDKMNKIISYCKEQNINVIPEFSQRLPKEKS